ncbi:hypothetical protein BH09ACT13_BH09ACT13_10050 [soil metagenome]
MRSATPFARILNNFPRKFWVRDASSHTTAGNVALVEETIMKRALVVAALAIIAVPAALAVPPAGEEANAAKKCKAERAAMGAAAFAAEYGTNKNKKNAFGKCVSSTARELEEQNEHDALNAAKQCKAERAAMGAAAFAAEYGTNKNKKNAFGKRV